MNGLERDIQPSCRAVCGNEDESGWHGGSEEVDRWRGMMGPVYTTHILMFHRLYRPIQTILPSLQLSPGFPSDGLRGAAAYRSQTVGAPYQVGQDVPSIVSSAAGSKSPTTNVGHPH